jgi:hypothetical protein
MAGNSKSIFIEPKSNVADENTLGNLTICIYLIIILLDLIRHVSYFTSKAQTYISAKKAAGMAYASQIQAVASGGSIHDVDPRQVRTYDVEWENKVKNPPIPYHSLPVNQGEGAKVSEPRVSAKSLIGKFVV